MVYSTTGGTASNEQVFEVTGEWDTKHQRLERTSDWKDLGGQGYVYEIRLPESVPTIGDTKGGSDVFYIGMSSGRSAKSRLDHLADGTHSACRALQLAALAYARPSQRILSLTIRIIAGTDSESFEPALLEVERLNCHARQHGQLPIGNGAWEGWLAGRILKHLRDQVTRHPDAPRKYRIAYDVNDSVVKHTVIDLYDKPVQGKGTPDEWSWMGALVWAWPSHWQGERNADESQWHGSLSFLARPRKTEAFEYDRPDWMRPVTSSGPGSRWHDSLRVIKRFKDTAWFGGDGGNGADLKQNWDQLNSITSTISSKRESTIPVTPSHPLQGPTSPVS